MDGPEVSVYEDPEQKTELDRLRALLGNQSLLHHVERTRKRLSTLNTTVKELKRDHIEELASLDDTLGANGLSLKLLEDLGTLYEGIKTEVELDRFADHICSCPVSDLIELRGSNTEPYATVVFLGQKHVQIQTIETQKLGGKSVETVLDEIRQNGLRTHVSSFSRYRNQDLESGMSSAAARLRRMR